MAKSGEIFPKGLSELAYTSSLLAQMVVEERIDPLVFKPLTSVLQLVKQNEDYWQFNKNVSAKSAFAIYHTWRNMRLIISKMVTRLTEAQKQHENPKTATDSLRVMPSLLHTFTLLLATGGKELMAEESAALYKQVTALRNTAYHAGMLPSAEEELAELDVKALVEEFERFAGDIKSAYIATQGSGGN